jgi:hypothetical protein
MADPTPADAPAAPLPAPLSGKAALIVGAIGGLIAAVSPFLPAPWSMPVTIVGFLAASLAGLGAAAPKVAEGKPVLQGGLLTVATTALTLEVQFFGAIPQGWPQSIALGLGALLAWLTGHALPHLGSPSTAQLEAAQAAGDAASAAVATKADAVAALKAP